MKTTTAALAAIVLLALTACKDYSGKLTINQKISLKQSNQLIPIHPGTYSAKIKIQSKNKIQLVIQAKSGEVPFTFKTNTNLKELKSGQRISIPTSVSGQPYPVDGLYNVTVDRSEIESGIESCTYYEREYRCRDVQVPEVCETATECDPRNPNQCKTRTVCHGGGYREECGMESIPYTGRQRVEFYYSTKTENVTLKLLNADGSVAGNFRGSSADTNKHYTHQDICR